MIALTLNGEGDLVYLEPAAVTAVTDGYAAEEGDAPGAHIYIGDSVEPSLAVLETPLDVITLRRVWQKLGDSMWRTESGGQEYPIAIRLEDGEVIPLFAADPDLG